MGHGHPLGVIGGVFGNFRRIVFQLARGGGQGVILRILIEIIEACGDLIQLLLLLTGHHEDLALLEFLPGHIILAAGGLVEEANPFFLAHVVGVGIVIFRAQLFCHLGAHVKVGNALPHRRAAGMLQIDGGKRAGGHIVAQIVHLMLRDHREDDIREVAVVFQPGMLRHDALNGGILIGPHGEVAVVPAGHLAWCVRPDHVNPAHAVPGILHLLELVLLGGLSIVIGVGLLGGREALEAPPFRMTLDNRLVNAAPGNELLGCRQLGKELNEFRGPLLLGVGEHIAAHVDAGVNVAVHRAQRVADDRDLRHEFALEGNGIIPIPKAPFNHFRLMHAGLANPAHSQQHDLQPGRLRGIGPADIAAAVAVDDGGGLLGPIPSQSFNRPFLHAALFTGPGGSFGYAVLLAQHIVLELIEAIGVLVNVFLVIGALGDPDIRNGQLQGRIGIGQNGNPLIRMNRRAIVQVGTDIDAFQADLRQPVAQPGGHMADHAQGRCFGIAAPKQQQIRVLGNVGIEVGLRRHFTDRLTTPDIFCTPEPALPGVHIAHL